MHEDPRNDSGPVQDKSPGLSTAPTPGHAGSRRRAGGPEEVPKLRASKQKYVRRGLKGSFSDARAMRMRTTRASLTMLWILGGFWPRLLITAGFMAVATLCTVAIVLWGPSGWLRVIALIVLAIVLMCVFIYAVTSPRDPWEATWWHPFDD